MRDGEAAIKQLQTNLTTAENEIRRAQEYLQKQGVRQHDGLTKISEYITTVWPVCAVLESVDTTGPQCQSILSTVAHAIDDTVCQLVPHIDPTSVKEQQNTYELREEHAAYVRTADYLGSQQAHEQKEIRLQEKEHTRCRTLLAASCDFKQEEVIADLREKLNKLQCIDAANLDSAKVKFLTRIDRFRLIPDQIRDDNTWSYYLKIHGATLTSRLAGGDEEKGESNEQLDATIMSELKKKSAGDYNINGTYRDRNGEESILVFGCATTMYGREGIGCKYSTTINGIMKEVLSETSEERRDHLKGKKALARIANLSLFITDERSSPQSVIDDLPKRAQP